MAVPPRLRHFARLVSTRFSIQPRGGLALFSAALGTLLAATSCGDGAVEARGSEADGSDAVPTHRYQFDPDLAPEVTNGLAVAEVIARGNGCPPGRWFTELERDGKSFRVRLVGYETQVDETRAASTRSCVLSIKLQSRVPVAFALRSIAYIGYAFLDDGVRARFDTQSYFEDEPPRRTTSSLELVGPYDAEFVEQAPADLLRWSECGLERDVHVRTSIGVHNAAPRGIGFIGIGEAHGSLPTAVDTARFGITFGVRTCDRSVDAGVPASAATPGDAGLVTAVHPPIRWVGNLDGGVPDTERAAPDTK